MANPKRKTSKARRDRRRSHDALKKPPGSVCPGEWLHSFDLLLQPDGLVCGQLGHIQTCTEFVMYDFFDVVH